MNIKLNKYMVHRSAWIADVTKDVAINTEKAFVDWTIEHRSDDVKYSVKADEFNDNEWQIYVSVDIVANSYPDMYIRAKEANRKLTETISTIEQYTEGSN